MERYPQTMVNIKVSPEGKLAFHTDPKVKKAIQQATATLNGEGRVIVRRPAQSRCCASWWKAEI